jgi:uncharacterized protein (DUF1778 family)
MEVDMLSRKKHAEWALKEHKDRDYQTEAERKFFEAVENPKPATDALKRLVQSYGNYHS